MRAAIRILVAALALLGLEGCGTRTCDPTKQLEVNVVVTRKKLGKTEVLMRNTGNVTRNAVGAMLKTCPNKAWECQKWETGPDASDGNLCAVNGKIEGVLQRAWDRAGLKALPLLDAAAYTPETARKSFYQRTKRDRTVVEEHEIWAWALPLPREAGPDDDALPPGFFWAECKGSTVPTAQATHTHDASNHEAMIRGVRACTLAPLEQRPIQRPTVIKKVQDKVILEAVAKARLDNHGLHASVKGADGGATSVLEGGVARAGARGHDGLSRQAAALAPSRGFREAVEVRAGAEMAPLVADQQSRNETVGETARAPAADPPVLARALAHLLHAAGAEDAHLEAARRT